MTTEEAKRMIDEIVKEAVKPLKEQQGPKFIEQLQKEGNKMETKEDKGLRAARIVRALAAAKGDPEKAAAYAKKNYDDAEVVKALSAGTDAAGGYLVPVEYSSEIIELLRPQSVVRRMGAMILPMTTGKMTIPKVQGGAYASYIMENTNIPVMDMTFDSVELTWKKLVAMVPISNDLLRYSSPAADTIVRDDLIAAIAEAEDTAFIRGVGVNTPRGLLYWAPQSNKIHANASVTLDTVTDALSKAVLALKEANVRFVRPGWIMSPRTEMYLLTVRDGYGNYAFRSEMLTGKLFGFPYAVTTVIPENTTIEDTQNPGQFLTVPNTEMYLVDFADAVIGESMQLAIDVSTEASYDIFTWDQGRVPISAFTHDQTLIRVITEHDFVMRHPESVAVITEIKWGV